MDRTPTIQYQVHTEPVLATPETVTVSRWLIPLSDPVRTKRINTALQAPYLSWGWDQFPETPLEKWYAPLSEPRRFKKGQPPHLQQAYIADPFAQIGVDKLMSRWYIPLSEPRRFKRGLPTPLQHYFEAPPRLIPKANVLAILAGVETNSDVFLGAINVYSGAGLTISGAGARVSVIEIKSGGDPVSVIEQ